jgi:hypothetical protein
MSPRSPAKRTRPSHYQKEAEEAASADYQERMEAFDNVESAVPVTTMPTASGQD